MVKASRLLVIDDDAEVCEYLENAARPLGFDVRTVTDPDGVDEIYRTYQPTVVVLDLVMPERDGIQICGFSQQRVAKPISH